MQLPPFEHYPDLAFGRVMLRELKETDAPFLREVMVSGGGVYSIADAAAKIRSITGNYRSGNGITWTVTDAQTDEPVGTIGYYRGFENGRGEIGFVLLPAFEGKGFMSEAVSAVRRFGREVMQLSEIIAVTRPSNERAIRLLERQGFTPKGTWDADYIWYQA